MESKKSHTIRNGIIATVVGGVLLTFWPPFLVAIKIFGSWIWKTFLIVYNYFLAKHVVYGWIISILTLLSLFATIQLAVKLRKNRHGYHKFYTKDNLFGVDWHWGYINGEIIHLWCLCPDCKSELVYSEFIPDRYNVLHDRKNPKTDFTCEKCDINRISMPGNKNYVLGTVEREIRRKIRTEEWKESNEMNR